LEKNGILPDFSATTLSKITFYIGFVEFPNITPGEIRESLIRTFFKVIL
jgi:hypothetical protein